MRKLLFIISILLCYCHVHAQDPAYPVAPAAPQNIAAAEYFIDTDPGIGSGIPIAIVGAVNISGLNINVNVTGLTIGIHYLYIRTRNNAGNWAITAKAQFLYDLDPSYPSSPAAVQNITKAEYIIDNETGFGSGTAITLPPGVNINNLSFNATVSGLSNGTHRIALRSLNSEGRWSISNLGEFIVDADPAYPPAPAAVKNIVRAEYVLDSNIPFGTGTAIPVSAATDISGVSFVANIAGTSDDTHFMQLRTQNADGLWSITNAKDFIVFESEDPGYPAPPAAAQNITTAEYFFDTDPGFGNGTSIPVTAGTDISDIAATLNITGLSNDFHMAYLRTKNQEGKWSITSQKRFLKGALEAEWGIDPATGHDYGTVQVSGSSTYTFKIRNKGTLPVVLDSVVVNNAAFTASFTKGTEIPVNDSLAIPVTFAPAAVGSYAGQLKITSSTAGLDFVTTLVSGTGFTPAVLPELKYVTVPPYNGADGVDRAAGQTGLYTYKILYQSFGNHAPGAGFPKLGIDRNGDGDFDDTNEGMYTMNKEGTGTDYAAGIVYTLTVEHPDYSSTLGYQFFAKDDLGNDATAPNAAYKVGPVVTFQLLDLRIFANDISFSKNNPLVGEPFTVTANVSNSSAFTASNVPIKFYRDTILLGSAVIPVVDAFSTATVTKVFSFPADGFIPIKVWIDSSRTLNETNVLNNYAIRPVTIGTVTLPGGINVTSLAIVQNCPVALLISGTADYYGTSVATSVAGAEVTIRVGSQTYYTTTDASGNYSFLMPNTPCGGSLVYTVSITDFTFTSNLLTKSVAVPCPPASTCNPAPQPGVAINSQFGNAACSLITGASGQMSVTLTYRSRNEANFWNLWDKILKDTVKIYQNGVLIQTYYTEDGATVPGAVKTFQVPLTLNGSGANVIEARQTYVYNEFFENEDNFYHGIFTNMSGYASSTLIAEADQPDLTINNFSHPGFTSFGYSDANIKCGNAGAHRVLVYDSVPGGVRTLIKTETVSSLSGRSEQSFTYNDPLMAAGDHFIRIVTDADGAVGEQDESNNVFETSFFVPAPDLTVTKIVLSNTALAPGSQVRFTATIKNTGVTAGFSRVSFTVNGVLVGNKINVAQIPESSSITVTSGLFTVTSADKDCPVILEVIADADSQVTESDESNNKMELKLGSDLVPYMLPNETGSASNPVIVRVSNNISFYPLVRNMGSRDIRQVNVKFVLDGINIGKDSVAYIAAGEPYAAPVTFRHSFTVAGDYVVRVTADTANDICEASEINNEGDFYIRVVETNPDYEVLSQYISPSSLNPNPGQSITLVGTVKNAGLKNTPGNVLRFMVDDIQLGADVPLNGLKPGQDTTVQATATYSSLIPGIKVMKIVVDPAGSIAEEREDNNEATRILIVGDAPDMARSMAGAIRFGSGFTAGDSVIVSYKIKNNGAVAGSAWVRFLVYNNGDALLAMDSLPFTLAAGASATISKKMFINADKGMVVAQIINCTPMEFDLLNNNDTLPFNTVIMLTQSLTVNKDLDMKQAEPDQLPGWIGGKLVLGDHDLIVEGRITSFDTSHFIVTNGTGRVRMVNNNSVNTFPVGASLYSTNFVKINNEGTADNFSVGVLPYVLNNGTSGDTVRTGNVNRTWLIEEQTPGGSNATLELFWNIADELPGFAANQSRMAHFTSSWQLGVIGAAITDSIGRLSRLQAGYTSFSPFTVTSGSGVVLPLRLLQFDATGADSKATLTWKTANEVNTDRFVIQHSKDGRQFSDIGSVQAYNMPGVLSYRFVHAPLTEPLNYYRLKMMDRDGSFTLSDIKLVRYETGIAMQAFPSPAMRYITVKGIKAKGSISVANADGKLVKEFTTTGNSMPLDLGNLPGGIYILTYKNQGIIQHQRIMKQ